MRRSRFSAIVVAAAVLSGTGACGAEPSAAFAGFLPEPAAWRGVTVVGDTATLTAEHWAYLVSPDERQDADVSVTITVRTPGGRTSYFGESWSVWPDKTVADQGWDAGVLVRAGDAAGYRIQVSASLGEIALVKFPAGGYVQSVPLDVRRDVPFSLEARVRGNRIAVLVDGNEALSFLDPEPLPAGRIGIGANSGATVDFSRFAVAPRRTADAEATPAHAPDFRVRKWLGGRSWVFDGKEPILLLPDPASSFINNVKLRPGVRPLLAFNSHWDVQNQGAYPEAKNDTADVAVSGGGTSLTVSWAGRHEGQRFATSTRMTVGWDGPRSVYAYDIDSELRVLPGDPFVFRYGFDFEHHTPLDPFNWQYLIFRKADGSLSRRPVCPVDPGPQFDLEAGRGLRVWHGRHEDPLPLCPAVEYRTDDTGGRKLNTAVCAAFYDTGVSYPAETLAAGKPVRVRYRYTGYPAAEVATLFAEAKTYDSPLLDPDHHYIFAEWPRTTFGRFCPLSESWPYGRVPFMSGHNRRPSYELARVPQSMGGSGMKLGPTAFGAASLPLPAAGLPAGRYVLSVMARGDNLLGPGGRIELTAADKAGTHLLAARHHVGSGSFDWRQGGFAFELPAGTRALTLGFGNAGTGSVVFAAAEFRRLESGERLPVGVAPDPQAVPPREPAAPDGALVDYRMAEGRGLHVLDSAGGPFGFLELANVSWVNDAGRTALRFADDVGGRAEYPRAGGLDLNYLRHSSYAGRATLPVALAGHHGGDGIALKGFTLVAWVKPAAEMGSSEHNGGGDILGLGARRVIVRLSGKQAPYRLQAALNVSDVFTTAEAIIDAERWCQVAVSGELKEDTAWRVHMYRDAVLVHDGTTTRLSGPLTIPRSVVLGAELFYFHDSYYRGLIGRTLVFDRPLGPGQLASLPPPERRPAAGETGRP